MQRRPNVRALTRAGSCLMTTLLTLAVAATSPRAQTPPAPSLDDQASAIYDRAAAAGDDPAALTAALADIEALAAAHPEHAPSQYVRGILLSALSRPADALAAYEAALAIRPDFSEALYNAGVVLLNLGREDEALDHFDRASAADPTLLDAWFNAGQLLYNRRDYPGALDRWSHGRSAAPDDFDLAKKVLQAQNALGLWDAARATRDDLLRIWHTSSDPAVRGLTDYVFDQFPVGDEWVYAYETLDPSGDLYNVYLFDCTRNDTIVRSVRLESSAVIREMGHPYILGVQLPDSHTTLPIGFDSLPDYATLRPIVIDVIGRLQRGEDLGGATSTPSP
jgi:tetratricopeptide (TPR) repeat protein